MPLLNAAPNAADFESKNGSFEQISPEQVGSEEDLMPIAIVGMACRFPGDGSSLKGLWDMCCEGRSAWSEIPRDRFNLEGFWHPEFSKHGCLNARGAHFLREDVGLFDAPFFNISPNEAKAMDPQQRLLLECTYEALENGGIPLHTIVGKPVGVYVGASASDYSSLLGKDPDSLPTYATTGTVMNILANRLSYVLDLKGPSLAVDTACSSSLVALHLACQSLRCGESQSAIVGGVYILLSPDNMIGMSSIRLFGEEGRCYTYDDRASGYGRGEGVASIILKPLQDAIEDGDHIHAIIRNSGINQDGKTAGITVPNQKSQEDLIRSVYNAAGLDVRETNYVEAHGTGTSAGDPVEAGAIANTMAFGRNPDDPLLVGCVKTNIGHLEAGSGLAGIVKTALMLKKAMIPPNINFRHPNKHIPLRDWKLKAIIPVHSSALGLIGRPGTHFSTSMAFKKHSQSICEQLWGTNAHVIMEASPQASSARELNSQNGAVKSYLSGSLQARPGRVYVLTAADKASTSLQLKNLASYLKERQEPDSVQFMEDLAYTLGQRRSLLEWRVAVPAFSMADLAKSVADAEVQPTKMLKPPRLGFVFTGQGSQWHAMGRELMADYPIFMSTLRQADKCLSSMGAPWSLLDELRKDAKSSRINDAYISQPATTAIQIALTVLLSSWNVSPVAVTGHSSGEIAAAFAAGALSVESCLSIAYHRGMLASTLTRDFPNCDGGMLAIGASPAELDPILKRLKSGSVVIACINAPSLVTASGDRKAITELQQVTESQGLLTRRLRVDVAYHSQHMQAIGPAYLKAISHIKPGKSSYPKFYSSLNGCRTETDMLDSNYWVENMISPVQFSKAVDCLCAESQNGPPEDAIDVLIEIGPHSALSAPIKEIFKSNLSSIKYLHCLARNMNASITTLQLASSLFTMGYKVDLAAVNFPNPNGPAPQLLTDLPSYPWMHARRHWHESRLSLNHRFRQFPRNDIIGANDSNDMEPRWRNILRVAELPWLLHHKVQSSTIFPLTGYLSMVIEAAYQRAVVRGIKVTNSTRYNLREIVVSRSLVIFDSSEIEITISLKPYNESSHGSSDLWDDFSICSWAQETGWAEHCHGLVSVIRDDQEPNLIDAEWHARSEESARETLIETHKASCSTSINCQNAYDKFAQAGLEFGPTFRNMHEAHASPGRCIGIVKVPRTAFFMPKQHETSLILHPATFDSCLHAIPFALNGGDLSSSTVHLPSFVKAISVSHGISRLPGDSLQIYASAHGSTSGKELHASLMVMGPPSENSIPVIEIEGFVGSALPSRDSKKSEVDARNLCWTIKWDLHLGSLQSHQYEASLDVPCVNSCQIENLERAAFYYVHHCLNVLSDLDSQRFQDHHKKLYRVLRGLFNASVEKTNWLDSSEKDREEFLTMTKSSDPCGEMVCRIGESLVPILQQEVDPLSIMLEDDLLEQFYRSVEELDRGYRICASYVDKLAHENPRMRILEIGAGTGGTTRHILNSLRGTPGKPPRFKHYEFTDLSPGFFAKAKDYLREWGDLISYNKLNIEKDPITQGYESESFDLVVAGNVLHATASIDRTLQHIRKILKPGGKLVLLEITSQKMLECMIFGTLPGWWVGEESFRQDGPLLTESEWESSLRRTGFSGLDGSVSNGDGPQVLGSVMFSTAVAAHEMKFSKASIVYNEVPTGVSITKMKESLETLTGALPTVDCLVEAEMVDKFCIFLELDHPLLSNLTANQFNLVQKMVAKAKGVLWVVRGAFHQSQAPEANMAIGLARAVRSENSAVKIVILDLDGKQKLSEVDTADVIVDLFKIAFNSDAPRSGCDMEYAERNGRIEIPRVIHDLAKDAFVMQETQPPVLESQPFLQAGRTLQLKVATPGLLDSIYFADDKRISNRLEENEVEIDVKVMGMNFKDVMIGLGQVPYQDPGLEFSGIVTAVGGCVSDFAVGNRVCGLGEGSYTKFVRVSQVHVQKIPDDMTFTKAASIPAIFMTAYCSLIDVGRLSRDESVLIHAAAGGVGQAAIMLARRIGAQIFVTVGSKKKKDFIMDTYQIAEECIFSSRDTTFQKGIKLATNGRGVDVVLNSLAGDGLRAGWNCLAPFGRFVEIGRKDFIQNSRLEMENFLDLVTFSAVDLPTISRHKPELFRRIFSDVMDLHRAGALKTVSPITTYSIAEAETALRLMQSGKHMGKIVLDAQSDAMVMATPLRPHIATTRPDASYLITGGTGGLGQSITRWLARQGAKYIILASRSGLVHPAIQGLVDELGAMDVEVAVHACDISDRSQVANLVEDSAKKMPPIRGVIHGAMVLKDVLFENSTFEDYMTVIKPRVHGTWILHECLARTELDFFVMLASGSGITGVRGQSAYAATNTFLDAFAHFRNEKGLSASVIDLGIVADVGYVARNLEQLPGISTVSHDRIEENEFLALVKGAISGWKGEKQVSPQTLTGYKLVAGKDIPWWASDPRFSHVLRNLDSIVDAETHDPNVISVRKLLPKAKTLAEATQLVCEGISRKLSSISMIPADEICGEKPIASYGLDSLVALELRNWIVSELDTNIPLLELIYSGSIVKLARTIATNSTLVDPSILEGEDSAALREQNDAAAGAEAAFIASHIANNVSAITSGRSVIATNGATQHATDVENDVMALATNGVTEHATDVEKEVMVIATNGVTEHATSAPTPVIATAPNGVTQHSSPVMAIATNGLTEGVTEPQHAMDVSTPVIAVSTPVIATATSSIIATSAPTPVIPTAPNAETQHSTPVIPTAPSSVIAFPKPVFATNGVTEPQHTTSAPTPVVSTPVFATSSIITTNPVTEPEHPMDVSTPLIPTPSGQSAKPSNPGVGNVAGN
ncbi:hypothetical protein MMC07_004822 [Pseudocyphellaria aurata]|nr:hypothetical protein [Pseudocyphellaria aurata]